MRALESATWRGGTGSVHGPRNAGESECTVSPVWVYDLGVTVFFTILLGVILAMWAILVFGEDY